MNDSTDKLPDELEMLKQRARLMGIEFSNNIKVDTLRARIAAKLEGEDTGDDTGDTADTADQGDDEQGEDAPFEDTDADAERGEEETAGDMAPRGNPLADAAAAITVAPEAVAIGAPAAYVAPAPAPAVAPRVRKRSDREILMEEATKLIRVRITNLDPKKKDLPGEIFTVANEYIGTIRKYVPFGEHTDEGYHIPYCIYQMMDSRRFVSITTTRDKKTGLNTVKTRMAREFAIEILDPLTQQELNQLAQAQMAAGSMEQDDMA